MFQRKLAIMAVGFLALSAVAPAGALAQAQDQADSEIEVEYDDGVLEVEKDGEALSNATIVIEDGPASGEYQTNEDGEISLEEYEVSEEFSISFTVDGEEMTTTVAPEVAEEEATEEDEAEEDANSSDKARQGPPAFIEDLPVVGGDGEKDAGEQMSEQKKPERGFGSEMSQFVQSLIEDGKKAIGQQVSEEARSNNPSSDKAQGGQNSSQADNGDEADRRGPPEDAGAPENTETDGDGEESTDETATETEA